MNNEPSIELGRGKGKSQERGASSTVQPSPLLKILEAYYTIKSNRRKNKCIKPRI